ncbi:response regulator [Waterburya agarophytonicola K14]|uniref:histidine kinase n=1 Tax=Waterburya agarophytonicola KI4 TaxID=2874699 RepID=A0A964BNJ4_9CYAN|nr:response regulator [Waterburya agarophytonicola]MCC0175972.1 response regulator [Waterburya agarophytonicola KI4]
MRNLMVAQDLNNILVVDDTPQNLHLLVDILTKYEYKVRPVPNGKLALSAIEINPPDLILLDIMMPDLDGYQVCKELKSNPKTRNIPIIFISAIDEPVDKVKAFALGGVDYITKPFQMHEVLIRVRHQLSLVNLKKQLKEKNKQLNETVDKLHKNHKQIVKSSHSVVLEKITSGITTQVNSPLSAINDSLAELNQFGKSNLKNLPDFLHQLSIEQQKYFIALLKQSHDDNITMLLSKTEKQQLKDLILNKLAKFELDNCERVADMLIELGSDEEIEDFFPLLTCKNYLAVLENACLIKNIHKSIDNITQSSQQFNKIITDLNNYAISHQSSAEKRQAHLKNTIEMALSLAKKQIPPGIRFMKNYGDVPSIYCYPEELQKLWYHLIKNAIDAIGSLGIITINIHRQDENLLVDIIDTGEGIDPEIVEKMCDPFFTTKSPGENTGLGLTIAKQIIDRHEGNIAVNLLSGRTTLPGKTKFTVSLPLSLEL